ncbi:basement membrane-specific heparan sulfate proteoglycan core protein-like [Lineus longissimus]|uniref:basement membrane-specific heparan sulfate proteoglycan core protein-like n=1 Tax=Lineus longissimus TaxID=88925 RepID=UPI00315D6CB5
MAIDIFTVSCACILLSAPLVHPIVLPKKPVLSGFEPAAIGSYRELVCDASQPDAGTITYQWYTYSIANGVENWEPKGPIGTSQKYIFNPVTEKKVFHPGTPAEPVSGKYLCRASNSVGTRDSEWGDLYVYTPCSLFTVSVSPPKPAIGSTFTLNCYIPNPSGFTVKWLKRNDTSSPVEDVAAANKKGCQAPSNPRYSWSSCSPPSITSLTKTFNLQVTNAQPSDSGYWICQDVSLSCWSDPVKPVVQAPPGTPQIRGFPSGPVIAGTLNLKCVASPPGDTYDWYKDGTLVTTSSSYDFQVTKESAGVYKCVARNAVGSASSTDKTLVVYYKPDSVDVSSGKTSSYVGETDKFTCTVSGGNPTPTVKLYFKRLGRTPVEVTQSHDRVMAKEDNQAEYYCEAKVTGYPALDMTSSRKTYSVTFSNTKVSFLNNPTAAVQVGQVKKFTCETDESNPVTYIKWYQYSTGSSRRNVTTGISLSERNGAYGGMIRISEWSVTATKAMDGGTIRCMSTYSLTGHDFTTNADTAMYVKYKPDSVDVSSGKTSSYVGETDKFTCTVSGGNPTVKLYFKRSGGTPVEVTQGQDRVMAKEDNQAEYYCEAMVTGYPAFDMTSSRKTYNVTFSNTKVSFLNNPTAAVQAGQVKKFTCETDESNPVTDIKWYQHSTGSSWRNVTTGISLSERNGAYGGKIRISEWSVTATKAMNGETVRCASTYSLTGHDLMTKADTTMYVKFNPSNITLLQIPPTVIYEGKLITIICEADSANPVANVTFHRKRTGGTWEQLASGITSVVRAAEYKGKIRNSTLVVTANRLDTQTVFKCEVRDGSFQMEQTTTVNVYYPANVVLSLASTTVKEGDTVTLTCEARGGNPTSYTYIWYYNWIQIPNMTSRQYRISSIQYNRSGEYRCRAVNYSPGGIADAILKLDVLYKAKWDPKLPRLLTVASKPLRPVRFTLHVIANPRPTNVTWYHPNHKMATGESFIPGEESGTYTLSKGSVGTPDYGNYTVKVTNSVGMTYFVFELLRPGPPRIPCCMKSHRVTAVSVTLIFKSNFNGGSQQQFTIESKNGSTIDRYINIADPGFAKDVVRKIAGLKSNSMYEFRVKADNEYGSSGYGGVLTVHTPAAPSIPTFTITRKGLSLTVVFSASMTGPFTKFELKFCGPGRTPKTTGCTGSFVPIQDSAKTNYTIHVTHATTTYVFYLDFYDGDDVVYSSGPVHPENVGRTTTVPAGSSPDDGMIAGVVVAVVIVVAVVVVVVVVLHRSNMACFAGRNKPEGSNRGDERIGTPQPESVFHVNRAFEGDDTQPEPVYVNDPKQDFVKEVIYDDVNLTGKPSGEDAARKIEDMSVKDFKQWLHSKYVTESTYERLAKNGFNEARFFVILQREDDIKEMHIKPLAQEALIRKLVKDINETRQSTSESSEGKKPGGPTAGEENPYDEMENQYAALDIKPDVTANQTYAELKPLA